MTEGMKTSEFILALITMVIGAALVIFGSIRGLDNLVTLGVTLITGGSAGYGLSRGLAKLGNTAPATVDAPKDAKSAADVVSKT